MEKEKKPATSSFLLLRASSGRAPGGLLVATPLSYDAYYPISYYSVPIIIIRVVSLSRVKDDSGGGGASFLLLNGITSAGVAGGGDAGHHIKFILCRPAGRCEASHALACNC